MQIFSIYKKWNFLIFLNNLVFSGFYAYSKKIIYLRFDISNFYFWIYSKKIKFQNKKIMTLKKKFNWY
jgi:hypothetical protein